MIKFITSVLAAVFLLILTSCTGTTKIFINQYDKWHFEDSIPFKYKHNKILVQITINNSPEKRNFIFDTGASLCVIDKELSDSLFTCNNDAYINVTGFSNTSELMKYSKLTKLKMGNITFPDVNVVTSDLSSFSDYLGIKIDGILGMDILKEFKTSINYEQKEITISNDSNHTKSDPKTITLKLNYFDLIPYANCTLNDSQKIRCLFDTGAENVIFTPLNFYERIKSPKKAEIYGEFKTGIHQKAVNSAYKLKISTLALGSLRINNLISETTNSENVILGNNFLEKFEVIFNYPKFEVYLTPISDLKFKNNIFSAGFCLKKDNNKHLIINGIYKNSPAEQCSLQIGDKISEINNLNVKEKTIEEWRKILTDNKDKTVTITIARENKNEVIELNKKYLIQ